MCSRCDQEVWLHFLFVINGFRKFPFQPLPIFSGVTPDDMVTRHIRQNELMIRRMQESETRCGRQIEKQIIGIAIY
jgi:hypothetical protein